MKFPLQIVIVAASLAGAACAGAESIEPRVSSEKLPLTANTKPPLGTTLAVLTHAVLDYTTRTGNATLIDQMTWSAGSNAYIRSSLPERESFYFEVQSLAEGPIAVGLTTGAANKSFFEMDMHGQLFDKNDNKAPTIRGHYGQWNNQKVGIAWNATRKEVSVYYNGVWTGVVMYPNVLGPVYPTIYSGGGTIKLNVGQDGFGSRVPKGFRPGSYRE